MAARRRPRSAGTGAPAPPGPPRDNPPRHGPHGFVAALRARSAARRRRDSTSRRRLAASLDAGSSRRAARTKSVAPPFRAAAPRSGASRTVHSARPDPRRSLGSALLTLAPRLSSDTRGGGERGRATRSGG